MSKSQHDETTKMCLAKTMITEKLIGVGAGSRRRAISIHSPLHPISPQ